MKYHLNYQYLPKGKERPQDDGETVQVSVDESGFALIPNVGDYVQLDNSMGEMQSFAGKVKSRFFFYIQGKEPAMASCGINIVIEQTDDDLGKLLKS